MSDTPDREMTLAEWVGRLYEGHAARLELAALERELAEAREQRLCAKHFPGPDDEDYGSIGCPICLMNGKANAERQRDEALQDARLVGELTDRLSVARAEVERLRDKMAGWDALPFQLAQAETALAALREQRCATCRHRSHVPAPSPMYSTVVVCMKVSTPRQSVECGALGNGCRAWVGNDPSHNTSLAGGLWARREP